MNQKSSRQSATKKFSLPPPQENTEEYMKQLYDHQKACEKAGKYLEADQAKKILSEVKSLFEQKTKGDIRKRHEQEKYEMIKAHQDEMQNFNAYWDGKVMEFEMEAQKMKAQLKSKHEEEFNQFVQELEDSIPANPKDSAEVLSLRKQEEQLAKQEQYLEAHHIQQKIQSLMSDELEKWNIQRSGKIKNLLQQLKQKQKNEENALLQKIYSASEEQKKMRYSEEEKMIQKYNNYKKELETSQQNELYKLDKNFQTASVYTISKQSKMHYSQQQEDGQQEPQEQ